MGMSTRGQGHQGPSFHLALPATSPISLFPWNRGASPFSTQTPLGAMVHLPLPTNPPDHKLGSPGGQRPRGIDRADLSGHEVRGQGPQDPGQYQVPIRRKLRDKGRAETDARIKIFPFQNVARSQSSGEGHFLLFLLPPWPTSQGPGALCSSSPSWVSQD